jgi:hypothetical protein
MLQVKRERDDGAAELRDSEREYLDKMGKLRGRHEDDIQLLQAEHTKKVSKSVMLCSVVLSPLPPVLQTCHSQDNNIITPLLLVV